VACSTPFLRGAFWVRRYAAQELASKAAVIVCAVLLGRLASEPALVATTCAAVEIVTFYAVAWRRKRGRPTKVAAMIALLREYGPAEGLDLVLRPAAMGIGLAGCAQPSVGVLCGSLAADLAFYAVAIAACRAGGLAGEPATRPGP
jgi:hypothetical protein